MDVSTRMAGQNPQAKWSQEACSIRLIICLEDCKSPKINIDQYELSFEGIGGPKGVLYRSKIVFFKDYGSENIICQMLRHS